MKSVLPVKMLSVLALVLLVFSVTEGRILSKCELKAQIEAALRGNQGGSVPGNVTSDVGAVTGRAPGSSTGSPPINVSGSAPGSGTGSPPINGTGSAPGNVTGSAPGNGIGSPLINGTGSAPGNATVDLGIIAKIVCSVERVSKFNTNLITTIQGDFKPPGKPAQRPNERPGGRPGQGRPGGRGKRSHRGGRGRNPPSLFGDSSEEDSRESNAVATNLLGIFQLSDRVACNPGSGQSLNICRMNCSALIDDDIRDDMTCLKTLLDMFMNNAAPVFAPRPKKQKHFLCVKECLNVNPLQYFSECV
ncbi:uncharacterized protein DDB_G0282077-like [Pseudorasbora parva]|uniref:uncharacterized protein DDB_G0282077-like n=1 Tax=Pseudorasbora parva TaxID=51549 RepID=UPI00351E7F41